MERARASKGDPGPAGPAHVVMRSGGSTVANGASGSATAQCQAGEIATGGGAQIGNANTAGNGGNGDTGGNGGLLGGNGGNTGAGNSRFANSGIPASGAAYLTGSAPNTTQGSAAGRTGSVTDLSGTDQSFTVWALCAS